MRKSNVLFIILLSILLSGATTFVYGDEMSMAQLSVIQGRVQSISENKETLVVKPSKGVAIVLDLGQTTDFVNVSSLGELKRDQRVKVWYRLVGEENVAVKVEKLLDVGC